MSEERHGFQAEVSRLLEIVAHSLYSDKAVFLRELISNASDACDRLRYLALTQPELAGDDGGYRVTLSTDRKERTLTIADNGIGMNHDDLVENLGTIARSGTAAFMKQMTGDAKKDMALIGQFGVGFYSAFMVSDRVEVESRKAGEDAGWRWVSDGQGEFTIAEAPVERRGTRITLHLKKDEDEFLEPITSRCRSCCSRTARKRPSTRPRRCGCGRNPTSPRSSTRNSIITTPTPSTSPG
jgi:molecular chaperone HtpG